MPLPNAPPAQRRPRTDPSLPRHPAGDEGTHAHKLPTARAVLLRQPGDHRVIGGVDGLTEFVVGNRAAGLQGVPARAPDVSHHRSIVRVAQQPLVGHLSGGATLESDRGARPRPEKGEDLAADLHDDVVLPRLVLPGAGLGQAVGEQLLPCHADRKSTRLNSSHPSISYAVFCLKKKKTKHHTVLSSKKQIQHTTNNLE